MVNRRRIIQWSLGPLSSNLYDLTEIDSREDDLSVLEIIVSSQKREVCKCVQDTLRQTVKQFTALVNFNNDEKISSVVTD